MKNNKEIPSSSSNDIPDYFYDPTFESSGTLGGSTSSNNNNENNKNNSHHMSHDEFLVANNIPTFEFHKQNIQNGTKKNGLNSDSVGEVSTNFQPGSSSFFQAASSNGGGGGSSSSQEASGYSEPDFISGEQSMYSSMAMVEVPNQENNFGEEEEEEEDLSPTNSTNEINPNKLTSLPPNPIQINTKKFPFPENLFDEQTLLYEPEDLEIVRASGVRRVFLNVPLRDFELEWLGEYRVFEANWQKRKSLTNVTGSSSNVNLISRAQT